MGKSESAIALWLGKTIGAVMYWGKKARVKTIFLIAIGLVIAWGMGGELLREFGYRPASSCDDGNCTEKAVIQGEATQQSEIAAASTSATDLTKVTVGGDAYANCSEVVLNIEDIETLFGIKNSDTYRLHMQPFQRISFDTFADSAADPYKRSGRLIGEVGGVSRCAVDVQTNIGRLHYKCGSPLGAAIKKIEQVLVPGRDYDKAKADFVVETLDRVWSTNRQIDDNISLSYTYTKGHDFIEFDSELQTASGLKRQLENYEDKLKGLIADMALIRACERSTLSEDQLLAELK